MIAKKLTLGLMALIGCAGSLFAADVPEPAKPTKEHEWLAQFVGEWSAKGEAVMGPDQPPMTCEGKEKGKMLGGLWMVMDVEMQPMGQPVNAVLTIGYDPQKKKFVGTWVDAMTTHMWKYEGSLDETGKVLTLEAEGPNMMTPGKMTKFRDVFEFKSKDHKILTSSMLGEDGKWMQFMTSDARRKN